MRKFILPLIVLLIGVGGAALLLVTAPQVELRPSQAAVPAVRVVNAAPQLVQIEVATNGTIVPRTESALVPEVSGRVLAKSPSLVSGGFFSKDDVLLSIDQLDYEVALEQARAGLARARSELANAQRNQTRINDLERRKLASAAQRDDADNRLQVARAALREAQARLSRAQRDLARTEVTAPYDGRVRSQQVDVGQFVNRGAAVAQIYAVDYVEARLPIHDEELAFLRLNQDAQGETVPVVLEAQFAGAKHQWRGQVVRTEGELDPRTRMVNVVARFADPYDTSDGRPPLSVGLFVNAKLIGESYSDIVVLPRAALVDEASVMVVDAESRLQRKAVELLRQDNANAYVQSGLAPGDRVVVSSLPPNPDNMLVRIEGGSPGLPTTAAAELGQ